jgi:hypothetical protein
MGKRKKKEKRRGDGKHLKGIATPCHKGMGPKSNFDINN